jgi:hypothetical protein
MCKCPPIPEATVGRLAKELDIGANDDLFRLDPSSFEQAGKDVADTILTHVGGYKGLLERYPFDRGAINNAVVELCLRLAEEFQEGDDIARNLRAAAIMASSSATRAGTRERSASIKGVVATLRVALAKLEEANPAFLQPGTLPERLGLSLKATHILLVFPNPEGSTPLRLHEEERVIREAIKLSKFRDNIVIDSLPAATVDDLRRALLNGNFDFIHYSGHADTDSIFFEESRGSSSGTAINTFVDEIGKIQGVKCLVMNTCLTLGSFHPDKNNFYIIGMESEVTDTAAIEFARGFYDAIGAGKTIDEAINAGKGCVSLKGLQDQLPIRVIKPASK